MPIATDAEIDEQIAAARRLRHAEAIDQVERVVARHARRVDELRHHQRYENRQRADDLRRATACWRALARSLRAHPRHAVRRRTNGRRRTSSAIATTAAKREPGDAVLPETQHDDGGEQRPDRRADVAAHLKQRLRETRPAARRHARDARRLRVQHRRADADERGRDAATPGSCRRATSSSRPTNVNAMPIASEYGCGRLSVKSPITGCSSDAVT